MAKRRRLDVPTSTPGPDLGGLETKSLTGRAMPPVAQVAGQAAAASAEQTALAEIAAARNDGRLAIRVPVAEIAVEHLVRDRIGVEDEDMVALARSIRRHGQRMPIEIMETGAAEGPRYGLISGWRRLAALKGLRETTGDAAYDMVLAVVRSPDDAGAAYVSMVEENEIRVGLSYYERARVAALAAKRGAFADTDAAVDALFATASRAKRSKIRSFLAIHRALGGRLRFPAHIGERLGLQVAAALKDGREDALCAALAKPADSPEAEAAQLTAALRPARPAPRSLRQEIGPGLVLEQRPAGKGQVLKISGKGVDDDLAQALRAFLEGRRSDVGAGS